MRRCLNILAVLILLTLGVEVCSVRGVGHAGGAAPLACTVDDNVDAELEPEAQRESAPQDACFWGITGQQAPERLGTVEVSRSFEEPVTVEACLRVRRHRWLCVECC